MPFISNQLNKTLKVPGISRYGVEFKFWQRLEPRSRTENFTTSIQAQIHDPLWMLTRQWQFGEFKGDDAGSPVKASIQVKNATLTNVQMGMDESGLGGYDSTKQPLEKIVEREPSPINWRIAVQIGQQLERELSRQKDLNDNERINLIRIFKNKFPLEMPTGKDFNDLDEETREFMETVAGRAINGRALINNGLLGENPDLPVDLQPARASLDELRTWYQSLYGTEPENDPSAWQNESLEYAFKAFASFPDSDQSDFVLLAPEYDGQKLDWTDFSVEQAPNTPPSIEGEEKPEEFIPTQLSFGGMPNQRWWEFEDRQVSFGDLTVNTTDLGKLLLMEFALIYGNDWFLFPLQLPAGSLCMIPKLEVTDVFGKSTSIERAGTDEADNWQRWDMFHLSHFGEPIHEGSQVGRDFLFLPPTLPRTEMSSSLEEVLFLRDEMANMVWGVERTIQNGLGEPQSGYEAYLSQSKETNPEKAIVSPIQYKLANTVPDNWIPYIKFHTDNSSRSTELRQAFMVRNQEDQEPVPIEPRSSLLLSAGAGHILHEETVSRAARKVRLTVQRTRWVDGSTHVWVGRESGPGRGEGSSGLRFDLIQDQESSS